MNKLFGLLTGFISFLSPLKNFIVGLLNKRANYISWKTLRTAAIILYFIFLNIFLIACGLIIIPVAIIVYAPLTATAKFFVVLSLGIVYLVGGIMASFYLFCPVRWKKMLEAAANQD